MIPPSTRLRRAIHLRSLSLVQRILSSNPDCPNLIRNRDPDDKNNTSLHLAASLGLPDVASYLLDQGHEAQVVSRNLDSQTPLMLAAAWASSGSASGSGSGSALDSSDALSRGQMAVSMILIERCPESIYVRDKEGMNAFLIAARHGALPLLQAMLRLPPPFESKFTVYDSPRSWLSCVDGKSNTALHHAAATGELKTVRLLILAGASDKALNSAGWTPQAYSATVAAEVYLRRLVQEREAGKVVDAIEKSAVSTALVSERDKRRAMSTVRMVGGPGGENEGDFGAAIAASTMASNRRPDVSRAASGF